MINWLRDTFEVPNWLGLLLVIQIVLKVVDLLT
jgi:hypothetical protein